MAHDNPMKAKQETEIIQLDKATGAQVRATIKWNKEEGQDTKYYATYRKQGKEKGDG